MSSQTVPEKKLIFDKDEWLHLQKICERGYPREVCGLLLGKPAEQSSGVSKVTSVVTLQNVLARDTSRLEQLKQSHSIQLPQDRMSRGGQYEFVIDPKEHFQKLNDASKEGFDQVGIFHSHPDHPAVPSEIDASQPFLAGWSNVIVAVDKGAFKEARSWFRITEESSFQEENIFVE